MTNAELLAKIKAEIERQIKDPQEHCYGVSSVNKLRELLDFIGSLESENPMQDGLEKEIERCVIEPYYDLNGVAVKGATAYLTVNDVADIARHFAQWGAEHLKK